MCVKDCGGMTKDRGAYKKLFRKLLGYSEDDFIPCAMTGRRAVDIHHIYGRGQRPGKKEELVNLMPMSREAHDTYGDRPVFREDLIKRNFAHITQRLVELEQEGRVGLVSDVRRHVLKRMIEETYPGSNVTAYPLSEQFAVYSGWIKGTM